ncbi:MAG: ATP-binding protein [Oligoflexia bacterium]|nr:ATP-binding protein [Oligoflexia bacterium]
MKTLIGEDVEVVTASSVTEGRRILEGGCFDSVITDYDVGDGTGFDLIDFLKESGIEIPVILITAYGSKELAVRTVQRHIFGYLEKPFDPEELCRLLSQALVQKTRGESERKLADFGLRSGEFFHEIATPLTLVDLKIVELRTLLDGKAIEPRVEQLLDLVEAQLARIKKIMRESRERLKAGGPAIENVFPVNVLFRAIEEQCGLKARRAGVALKMEAEGRLELVGDRERLLQVFVNLLNNAIDAVAEAPDRWVRVRASGGGEFIVFHVCDSGEGIPTELQQLLFNPLFTTKKEGGTGLGLSIASRIVKEHRGEIYYNSSSSNTEFVVKLPAARKP